MTEETTGAQAPEGGETLSNDEQAVETAAPEASPEQSEEQEGEAAPAEQKGEAAKVPDGVQQRINEITRKRREAERRADNAERKLKEFQSRDTSQMSFEDESAHRTLDLMRREQIDTDREAAQELAAEAYQARVEIAVQDYPDYHAVTSNPSLQITPAMAEVIYDSDLGPALAYHLGKNPAEAAKIAQLNPASQAAALGRLEARISAPKPTPKPSPKPVNPVGGKSTASAAKDPSKMTMAEYAAWRGYE
jgi:hypothetical protein